VQALWLRIRASYWFLPTIMCLAATLLVVGVLELDHNRSFLWLQRSGWVYTGGADGARAVLSTIAGSIITVAGTTFSITIAALTLASQQFGPRLLKGFIRDVGNQVVLGTFTSTFLYCILVLRTIYGTEKDPFVPHIAVSVGVFLALVSLGVLIYFIHHVAQSIQVSNVINVAADDLDRALNHIFPHAVGRESEPCDLPDGPPQELRADQIGYLEEIDEAALMRLAEERDLVMLLRVRPGDYVLPDQTIACVWPTLDADLESELQPAFAYGRQRTWYDDVEFAFMQIAEIGVRALSPAINDPFTAIICVDRITASMARLIAIGLPGGYRRGKSGALRMVVPTSTWQSVVQAAYGELRWSARTQPSVLARLERQLDNLIGRASDPELVAVLNAEREEVQKLGASLFVEP